MKALQHVSFGAKPEVREVPQPDPGPGEVLLRVTAAGICRSDLHIISTPEAEYRFGPPPLTLGHEAAGVVVEVGPGASQFEIGTPVLVYGPWGCGICRACSGGQENYCQRADGVRAPGISVDGALAEYLLVDNERHLVPLGNLDPVQAVALTDAGLTSYHAVKSASPKLGPGKIALVIGAGGLGHLAIQIIRALCPATIVAVDLSDDKLLLASALGADHVVRVDQNPASVIAGLTGTKGVDAIFDFVGSDATLRLARDTAAISAAIVLVGVGTGSLPVGYRRLPFEANIKSTFWGSRPELWEVVDLAGSGNLTVTVETYSLDEAPKAYERLANGDVLGRAVVVPS